jgi:hypothetical protein
MKIVITGKDKHQVTSIIIQNVSNGVDKITITTIDKWINFGEDGPKYPNSINDNNSLFIVTPHEDEYDIQIAFVPENEQDQKLTRASVYVSQNKDQYVFILIGRDKGLEVCKKENTNVLYKNS